MEHTFISEDYSGLLDQYKQLRSELDDVKQQLYYTTRQSKLSDALLKEYQSEIDLLQSLDNGETEKLNVKISQLEGTIVNLRLTHSENLSSVENELHKTEKENEQLKAEINALKQTMKNEVHVTSQTFNETFSLGDENEMLKENNERLKEAYEVLQYQQIESEKVIEQYKDELTQLRESLEIKRNELTESTVLLEKLNDDLFCARSELENYKSKPLDEGSKGNSLFAEVDDRRVHLQKTVNDMKTDYIRMKQEKSQHLKQISHLRKENADLQTLWKKDLAQFEEDKQMVTDSLKSHLNLLQEIVDRQKLELEQKLISPPVNLPIEYQFYQDMLDSKQKELKELEHKLSNKSLGEYLLTKSLAQANKEIRQLKLKVLEAEQLKETRSNTNENNYKEKTELHTLPYIPKTQRTPLRSCERKKENASTTNDEILWLDSGTTKSPNTFNIFNNRDRKHEPQQNKYTIKPTITNEEQEFIKSKEASILIEVQEVISPDKKDIEDVGEEGNENVEANKVESTDIPKKGVTFSDDTMDHTSNRVQRRCTKIFSKPKKMF